MRLLKVLNKSKKIVIGEEIELADTFFTRLKGLLGRATLGAGQGMLLIPCHGVHCIGMKFAIDVIFMDREKRVVWLRENLKPGDKESRKDAYCVLEVATGIIKEKRIQIGDILSW